MTATARPFDIAAPAAETGAEIIDFRQYRRPGLAASTRMALEGLETVRLSSEKLAANSAELSATSADIVTGTNDMRHAVASLKELIAAFRANLRTAV